MKKAELLYQSLNIRKGILFSFHSFYSIYSALIIPKATFLFYN
jgi:hypothetical protein